ncbi:MAG: ArnT family glycosyltransferase [Cyanobacteriota bacterium]
MSSPEKGLQASGIPAGLLALLAGLAVLLLLIWNLSDPLPPAWDEAQHLLQVQAFAAHLRRFRWHPLWWQQFLHLNQRYPPLTYWLGMPLAVWHPFSRADGQLLNLLVLGILAGVTQRIGRRVLASRGYCPNPAATGWLAAVLLLLYPGITSLAHVYMLELALVLAVTLAFWALLAYWQDPSWQGAAAVGAAVAAVLLTKWTGILFLLLPLGVLTGQALLRGLTGKGWYRGIPLAHMALAIGVMLLLCWPWYSANWLFVLSNGLAYADTAHYYMTCPAGSLCWWTTYLRWLPQQMSPFLCGLPLLALLPWVWRGVKRLFSSKTRGAKGYCHPQDDQQDEQQDHQSIGALWVTYGAGYLLYTLVEIKDIRFTLPLLPLLAVLSALGIQQTWSWLEEQASRSSLCQKLSRAWPWLGLGLASLALCSFGQPLTPGVAPFWRGIQMQWQGQQPAQELTDWLSSLVQPHVTTTLGVIPNTEQIASETLTYLAALHHWPLSFRAAGQTPWPELELSLLDGFIDATGEMGIVGPYGAAKQQIRQNLQTGFAWRPDPPVHLPAVGWVQTYYPQQPQVTVYNSPLEATEVLLEQITPLSHLGIPAWRLHWQGPARDLAQTLVWADLEDDQGQIVAERAWVLGQNRLQLNQAGSWLVEEILALPPVGLPEPKAETRSATLHLDWHSPQGPKHSLSLPWTAATSSLSLTSPEGSRLFWVDPLFLLQQAAQAAAVGDLQTVSLYLNAWTTLQYPTLLTDPDRTLTRKLLEGAGQRALEQGDLSRQIQNHYQQGLLLLALLQPHSAQVHFQEIVQLDRTDIWARAYLAFLRVFLTHDVEGRAGLQAELRYLAQPFCQQEQRDPRLVQVCSLFRSSF